MPLPLRYVRQIIAQVSAFSGLARKLVLQAFCGNRLICIDQDLVRYLYLVLQAIQIAVQCSCFLFGTDTPPGMAVPSGRIAFSSGGHFRTLPLTVMRMYRPLRRLCSSFAFLDRIAGESYFS